MKEEIAMGPAGGEVEPDPTNGSLHLGAHLEETEPNGRGLSTSERSPGEPLAQEMDQVVGEGVELKPQRVRSVAGAAETIGVISFFSSSIQFSTSPRNA